MGQIPVQLFFRWMRSAFLAFALLTALFSNGQTYLETFGQNRQQYRKFDWKYFDTKHFRVYHYDNAGRDLGRFVCEEAENDIQVIEKKLGGKFPKRFNIILYNSYEEYRQTNIGLNEDLQISENSTAGTVNLVGDKLVVWFTGKHEDLRHQIRKGMATVVMERIIFGENFKKMVKNALLLNLPEWVTAGYIGYLVDGWDAKSNSSWKSLLEARPKSGFYELSNQYPELAGKAFWKFVANQYKPTMVKSLLYAMQAKTNLNTAMKDKKNLNMKVRKAYDSCIKYYKNIYALDAAIRESPDSRNGLIALKVPKNDVIVNNINVSPRGSDIVYVEWRHGEYKIIMQKTSAEQEKSVLLEGGLKDLTEEPDPNYPIISYSSTGHKLAIVYKKGAQTRLRIYNSQKSKIENYVIPKKRCDRILGVSFMEDDDRMIFSAIKKSRTDLFLFTIKGTKIANITDDVWDDIAPVYVSGGSRTGILFLSNRPKPNLEVPLGVNELPTAPMNLYFYNMTTKRKELLKCTDIKKGSISQPVQFGYDNFAYLYDSNGIANKYLVLFGRDKRNMDSAYSVPLTNYSSSIISHQYNIAANEAADVLQIKNKYKVFFHDLNLPSKKDTVKAVPTMPLSLEAQETLSKSVELNIGGISMQSAATTADPEKTVLPEIKTGDEFQSEFSDAPKTPARDTAKPALAPKQNEMQVPEKIAQPVDSFVLTEITDSAYLKMKPAKYRLSFRPDFFSVRLDNSLLFSQYQSYSNTGGQYNNPTLGTLTTISLNELLENHRFTGGFQLPINLTSSTYFLQYQNFTRMLDWGLMFLHSQDNTSKTVYYVDNSGNIVGSQNYAFKSATDMLQGDLSYPISRVQSFKFHTAFRMEQLTPKAIDTLSLNDLAQNFPVQYWSFSRLEYVFDNTFSPAQNIRFGTRYKIYSEYMYEFNNEHENCYNIGLDYRTYKKIYKNSIWATRIAYAHSDGNNEVQYQLGGVDGWLAPHSAINSMTAGTPGFIALATNLRGYNQDARKGNNFAVINTEIRLPLVTTFVQRPVQSSFLKNLQLVTFLDAGTAWTGFLPTASATVANYQFPTISSNPSPTNNVFLTLAVPDAYGLAVGYGAGLRTLILGYFIRLDLAWSIDTPTTPVFYFSLGTDF
jgi:hypothetical protein